MTLYHTGDLRPPAIHFSPTNLPCFLVIDINTYIWIDTFVEHSSVSVPNDHRRMNSLSDASRTAFDGGKGGDVLHSLVQSSDFFMTHAHTNTHGFKAVHGGDLFVRVRGLDKATYCICVQGQRLPAHTKGTVACALVTNMEPPTTDRVVNIKLSILYSTTT